jgi:hypothetical protein
MHTIMAATLYPQNEVHPLLQMHIRTEEEVGFTSNMLKGEERLKKLYEAKAWESLPTTKIVHKQRRAIDRRFSGPKHRRTRDYSSDEDEGEGCTIA